MLFCILSGLLFANRRIIAERVLTAVVSPPKYLSERLKGRRLFYVEEHWPNGNLKRRYLCYRRLGTDGDSPAFGMSPPEFVDTYHGPVVMFGEDGSVTGIATYYAGVLHGSEMYFDHGKITSELTYRYGERTGIQRSYVDQNEHRLNVEEIWANGRSQAKRIYYPSGYLDRWVVNKKLIEQGDEAAELSRLLERRRENP